MKESKLSLLLTAALLCGSGKLDLACPTISHSTRGEVPLVGFEPLDPRNAHQAYVIRFGEGKKQEAEPLWSVQLGHALRQALFWAAVASVLL